MLLFSLWAYKFPSFPAIGMGMSLASQLLLVAFLFFLSLSLSLSLSLGLSQVLLSYHLKLSSKFRSLSLTLIGLVATQCLSDLYDVIP
jgi:hypothetical protein